MKITEQQNLMYAHQGAAPTADAIQKVGWHCGFVSIPKVVSVFSFSDFKAKAFRFCHFFCPLRRQDRAGYVTPDLIGGLASYKARFPVKPGMTAGYVTPDLIGGLASFRD